MKLGFLTAIVSNINNEGIAKWVAEHGFSAIEIACCPFDKTARRYAGVTHIDVVNLNKPKAKNIHKLLDGYGLTIYALAYYQNALHLDTSHHKKVISHLQKVLGAAELLECPIVGNLC